MLLHTGVAKAPLCNYQLGVITTLLFQKAMEGIVS